MPYVFYKIELYISWNLKFDKEISLALFDSYFVIAKILPKSAKQNFAALTNYPFFNEISTYSPSPKDCEQRNDESMTANTHI